MTGADIAGLVERLRECALKKHGDAWRRLDGGQDLSIGAVLAEDAADAIEHLAERLSRSGAVPAGWREALAPFAVIGAPLNRVSDDVIPDGASARFLRLDGLYASDFRRAHEVYATAYEPPSDGDAPVPSTLAANHTASASASRRGGPSPEHGPFHHVTQNEAELCGCRKAQTAPRPTQLPDEEAVRQAVCSAVTTEFERMHGDGVPMVMHEGETTWRTYHAGFDLSLLSKRLVEAALSAILSLFPSPAEATDNIASVVAELANERRRQIAGEGFGTDHDDIYESGEIARAAAAYALAGSYSDHLRDPRNIHGLSRWAGSRLSDLGKLWPWEWEWFKPKDRRRDLVRAGALIVAEIMRLDRITIRALRTKGGE